MIPCPRCGSENKDRAVLCSNCGAVLSSTRSAQLPSQETADPARPEARGGGTKGGRVEPTSHLADPGRGAGAVSAPVTGERSGGFSGSGPRHAASGTGPGGSHAMAPSVQPRGFAAWSTQLGPERSPEPDDLVPLVVGPTTLVLMILASLLLIAAAATPAVVATATDEAGAVTTILRYTPLDSAVTAGVGVLVLLGRHRGWTLARLLLCMAVLTAYLIFRRATFGHIPLDVGALSLQHVRLGPLWYLTALGTLFAGAAFVTAVRGRP